MATSSLIPHLQTQALALFFDPHCGTSGDSFQCRLLSLLHLLYTLGAALAVVLAIVVLFAVRAWYAGRNNQDIPPPKPERRRD